MYTVLHLPLKHKNTTVKSKFIVKSTLPKHSNDAHQTEMLLRWHNVFKLQNFYSIRLMGKCSIFLVYIKHWNERNLLDYTLNSQSVALLNHCVKKAVCFNKRPLLWKVFSLIDKLVSFLCLRERGQLIMCVIIFQ